MGSSVGLWRSALEFWKTLYSGVFVGVMSQPWILPETRLGRAWGSGLNLFRDVGLQRQARSRVCGRERVVLGTLLFFHGLLGQVG